MFLTLAFAASLTSQNTLRLFAVDEWHVSGSSTLTSSRISRSNLGVVAEGSERVSTTARFTGTIKRTAVDEGQASWEGTGTLSFRLERDKQESAAIPGAGGTRDIRRVSGFGSCRARINLDVDAQSGTYQWSVTPDDPEAGFPTSDTKESYRTGSPPTIVRSNAAGSFPEIAVNEATVPAGLLLLGSVTKAETVPPSVIPGASETGTSLRLDTWDFAPGQVKDHELVIVPPPGFAEWLPDPYSQQGQTVEVRLRVQKRGGGAPTLAPRSITVRLGETTKEVGDCLNVNTQGTTPDMAIASSVPSAEPGNGGQQIVVPMSGATGATATVRLQIKDSAAFARLSASCTFVDGRMCSGKVQTTGEPDLALPSDKNLNHIGDRWEALFQCQGEPVMSDNDQQQGNDKRGDGLTLFEEYRGLKLAEGLSRSVKTAAGSSAMDPKRKDLVVLDHVGATFKPGYARFERLSGIGVVVVRPQDLPETRLVNVHSDTSKMGDQYAVPVWSDENISAANEKTVGVTSGSTGAENVCASPKECQFVKVAPNRIAEVTAEQAEAVRANGIPMPYTSDELLAETIAHELAHAVGVRHHGDAVGPGDYLLLRTLAKQDPTRLLDPSGTHLPGLVGLVGAGRTVDDVGVKGSVASGDQSCTMCYANYFQWAHVWMNDQNYFIKLLPVQLGTRFCSNGAATGRNAPHGNLPGFFGPASEGRGNCLGQMTVRDW